MTTVRPPPADLAAEVDDAYGVDLLSLAQVRLVDLADPTVVQTVLDSVMKRLFDPRERDLLTVSAFSSAL